MMGLMRSNDDEKGTYSSLQQNLVGPDPDQVLRTSHATVRFEFDTRDNSQNHCHCDCDCDCHCHSHCKRDLKDEQTTLAQRFRVESFLLPQIIME